MGGAVEAGGVGGGTVVGVGGAVARGGACAGVPGAAAWADRVTLPVCAVNNEALARQRSAPACAAAVSVYVST